VFILDKDVVRATGRLFYSFLLRFAYTAPVFGLVVDEDGLSGVGGHVVVVEAGDGEVVDGLMVSGGLDGYDLDGLAVGGVEGVAFVQVGGWGVAAGFDVERVGGSRLDHTASGGDS